MPGHDSRMGSSAVVMNRTGPSVEATFDARCTSVCHSSNIRRLSAIRSSWPEEATVGKSRFRCCSTPRLDAVAGSSLPACECAQLHC